MTPPEGYDKIVCCINSFAGCPSEEAISIAARAELAALCARLVAVAEERAQMVSDHRNCTTELTRQLNAVLTKLAAAEARAKGLESGESFRTLTAMVKDRDKRIDALAAEVKTWKANHDEMKARNKLLRNRPDLPMERVVGYDEMMRRLEEAEARVRDLSSELASFCDGGDE